MNDADLTIVRQMRPDSQRLTVAHAVDSLVMVLHGGRPYSRQPTTATQATVLRMIPITRAVRRAVGSNSTAVWRPRFRVRGWNGDQAAPVADLGLMLDTIGRDYGDIPVVLVGHSMGARAALRGAGHPIVTAVAALTPWLPPDEPVEQLQGRRVLLAHGDRDNVTDPDETWSYAERARRHAEVAAIEVRGGGHAMCSRSRIWHGLVAEFTRIALDRPTVPGPVARSFSNTTGRGRSRLVL